MLLQISGHESLRVISGEAEDQLCEVVSADGYEVNVLLRGNTIRSQTRSRHFQHAANSIVHSKALVAVDRGILLGHQTVCIANDWHDKRHLVIAADEWKHDLRLHYNAFLHAVQRSSENGSALHLGDLRVHNRQPTASKAQHRVALLQRVDTTQADVQSNAKRSGQLQQLLLVGEGLGVAVRSFWKEFMQRRVQQANGYLSAGH
mmetsp:Transcript_15916/g.21924  ORF Transcript_15916/g.21924 Transcript_15916/m.21924 type:complete len:204 (-) Transcript_15916:1152-1763(-)